MLANSEMTPCGAMFDTFKRYGRIKHSELAELVLSGKQLADGRSPKSRANDRSWVSRFIVHAPVSQLQERYFADYSVAALHIANRLRSRRVRAMSDLQIIDMVAGEAGVIMERALAAARQDVQLYRNALQRLVSAEGHSAGERAEAALVLFVAVGCTGDVRRAVSYTMDCARISYDMETSTPSVLALSDASGALGTQALRQADRPFGLMRAEEGFLAGDVHWIDPAAGAVLGALAMGEGDITDVAADVSGEHARVFRDAATGDQALWYAEDLGSKNGTALVDGATGERRELKPGEPALLHPGDELHLGTRTVYIAIEGAVGV